MYRTWGTLADGLRNRESIAKALDVLVSSVFWVLMGFLALLLLRVNLSVSAHTRRPVPSAGRRRDPVARPVSPRAAQEFLVVFGTVMLSLSFAFGSTAQRVVHSLAFLFVTRAFDVGDRVKMGEDAVAASKSIPMYVHEVRARIGPWDRSRTPDRTVTGGRVDRRSG